MAKPPSAVAHGILCDIWCDAKTATPPKWPCAGLSHATSARQAPLFDMQHSHSEVSSSDSDIAPTAVPFPDPDHLLTLAAATRVLPPRRRDARPSPSTLYRWYRDGVRAADGRRIRLRTTDVGGTICTSRVWLAELSQALADARECVRTASDAQAVARVGRAASARRVLARAGLHPAPASKGDAQ